MGMRRRLRRVALGVERALDRLLTFKIRRRPPLIEPYIGYSTPEALIARGRVLTYLRRQSPQPEQGWFTNLRQMVLLFLTDEVEGVRLRAGRNAGGDRSAGGGPGAGTASGAGAGSRGSGSADAGAPTAVSDVEGYFTLVVPRDAAPTPGDESTIRPKSDAEAEVEAPARAAVRRRGGPNWTEVVARIEGSDERAALPVLVPGADARLGVISDIDDTVMETGAYSLARNLWTSLTGNALTRRVFPDSVALLDRLSEGGRNPVFYVSSSPWNLHHFLESVFGRAGVVPGPMFLRDLGISENPAENTHGGHKGAAIDTLMEANPGLPFWLLGDTGQHDAEIYLQAARRHPGRVVRVALREPGPGPDAEARAAMEALRALGVEVTSSRDFRAFVEGPAPAEIPAEAPSPGATAPAARPAAAGR